MRQTNVGEDSQPRSGHCTRAALTQKQINATRKTLRQAIQRSLDAQPNGKIVFATAYRVIYQSDLISPKTLASNPHTIPGVESDDIPDWIQQLVEKSLPPTFTIKPTTSYPSQNVGKATKSVKAVVSTIRGPPSKDKKIQISLKRKETDNLQPARIIHKKQKLRDANSDSQTRRIGTTSRRSSVNITEKPEHAHQPALTTKRSSATGSVIPKSDALSPHHGRPPSALSNTYQGPAHESSMLKTRQDEMSGGRVLDKIRQMNRVVGNVV